MHNRTKERSFSENSKKGGKKENVNSITFSGSPEIGAFLFQSLLVSFAFLHLLVLLQSVSSLNHQLSVFLIVMRSKKMESYAIKWVQVLNRLNIK